MILILHLMITAFKHYGNSTNITVIIGISIYICKYDTMYGRLQKKLRFCNCDYDCTTKYSRKISRNYNIPEIVITKRNT